MAAMPPLLPGLPQRPVPQGPLSTFSYLRAMRGSLIDGFDASCFREPIVQRRLPGLTITLLNSPSAIRHVGLENADNYVKSPLTLPIVSAALGKGLVTSEGQQWRADRKRMAPSFEANAVAAYVPDVRNALERSAARLGGHAGSGSLVSLKEEMMALTLDIISHSMFSGSADLGAVFADGSHRYQAEMTLSAAMMIPGIRTLWRYGKIRKTERILRELNRQMFALIETRRRAGTSRDDLLGRLLDARDDHRQPMSDALIRDQMVTIFVAGHETTALALMWSVLLLCRFPDALERARREIDAVVGDGELEHRHVGQLAYLGRVFQEALRLYPPVHSMAWRTPLDADRIDGVPVAAGSVIAIIPWVVHRHQLYWTDPDAFDPDRFLDDRAKARSRYSYIPFGIGRRTCIGASFAMMEGILALAGLLGAFDFELPASEGLEPRGLITLHPRTDPMVRVLRRRSGGARGSTPERTPDRV